MTYRRLFLFLLLTSTLALVALGYASRRNSYQIMFSQGPGHPGYHLVTYFSTVAINANESGPPSARFDARWVEVPQDSRAALHEAYGHTGRFRLKKTLSQISSGVRSYNHRLEFPIWVPWLFFVGGAFAFCRLMERRAAAGKEKALAEAGAAEKLTPDPS